MQSTGTWVAKKWWYQNGLVLEGVQMAAAEADEEGLEEAEGEVGGVVGTKSGEISSI